MATVDEMVIKWKMDSSNYNESISKIDKDMKMLKSEFGATDAELKSFGSTTDQLRNKQEYLNKMIELQKNKINSLKTAYEKTKKETGENSEASQKLAVKINNQVKYYNNLNNQLKETTNKLEEEEKELKSNMSAWNKLSNATEAAEEKISKATSGISKGIGAITTALGGASGVLGKFNNDYQKSLNEFEAKTGASQEQMEEFGETIKNVYGNNFGESFSDVSEAVATVNKYLGLTGESLTKTTELALGFRDSFDVDVSESIRASKALMDNFGITAEQAFNLMVQGQQNGLDYSGELIDSINEYSVQFKKLGFTAGDMFTILSNGAENGAFNLDKVGDAVKEFSIRAIDGSDSTAEGFAQLGFSVEEMTSRFAQGGESAKGAFTEVIQAIKNVDDPMQQSLIGVSLFGTMWEDLGPNVVTQLANVSDAYDVTKNSAEKLNQVQYNNLGDGLAGLWRNIQSNCLEPIQTQLMPKFNEIFSKIQAKMPEIQNVVSKAVTTIANTIVFLIDNIDHILPVVKAFVAVMLTIKTVKAVNTTIDNTKKAIDGLKDGFNFISTKGSNAISKIKSFGTASLNAAKSAGQLALNLGKSAIQFTKNAVQAGISATKMVAHKVATIATTVATKAMTIAQTALNFVMSMNPFALIAIAITAVIASLVLLYNKCEWFRNGVNAIWEAIKTVFIATWEAIKAAFELKINTMKLVIEAFKVAWNNICNAIKNIWNNICNGIVSAINNIKNIWQNVCNFFGSAWSSACRGIGSVFNGVKNTVIGIAQGMVNTVIRAVNWCISALNRISFDIPSWVPGIGGKSFGVNISKISEVSWLYEGGIIENPTLLNGGIGVGDAYKGMGSNAEAVIPLDSMYANLRNIVREESNNKQPIYVMVNVENSMDSKAIGKAVTTQVKKEISRGTNNYRASKGGLIYG